MTYEQIKYDLAVQLASIKFQKSLSSDTGSRDDAQELLEIFAATYDKFRKIPDSQIKLLLEES